MTVDTRHLTTYALDVPEDVSFRLQALSAVNNVSLGTALATASAVLLHKYCCEGALTIRAENLGRSETWVRLLPLDRDIRGDLSFEKMLARACEPIPEHPELFEILIPLEMQNELMLSSLPEGGSLKLVFRKEMEVLHGTWEYTSGAFEDRRIERMAEHLQTLLRAVTAAPTAPLSELNILGDEEKRQILIEWNQTDRGYSESSVPELVDQQVQRTPHAAALIQGDQHLTYSQLNEQVNRLANHLRTRGVGPEALVGLCVEQSLNAVVSVLGILKAGGAYVPLDPSHPQERLNEIASDANLSLAVTSARFRHRVPAGIETVCVDRDAALIAAENSATPATGLTSDSAAYVLYTSASTGKPKGVIGVHRSITNGLNSVSYAPDEICCLNTFLSFGFSVANLFLPLMRGVPVVILSDEQIRDTNQMMTVLEDKGVTRIVLIPSVLTQILHPDFRAASRLRKIRTIGVAGGKLTQTHLHGLSQVMPQAKLHNRYANTEIGTVAAMGDVSEGSSAGAGEIAIGRPAANTRIYILDGYMNPVPVGVAGELYVGATHLARGYLNRPDLTAERFLPDPFGPESGRRLFRTGDVARFRSNGDIEFIGRTDEQVKINGFRIDLTEVEQALAAHAGVSEAVAAIREIGCRQKLVAYVVPKPVGTPNASQLRSFLRQRLPGYMVPSKFVFLEHLPLGGNGKLDRKALPLPEPVRPKLETAYQPPGNLMEATIAEIWGDLLELDAIGIHDHFLDLGGDSLMAAQVAVRLAERFGVDVTPDVLVDRPTIASLAAYLAAPRAKSEVVMANAL